jgi:hypothetical protein
VNHSLWRNHTKSHGEIRYVGHSPLLFELTIVSQTGAGLSAAGIGFANGGRESPNRSLARRVPV